MHSLENDIDFTVYNQMLRTEFLTHVTKSLEIVLALIHLMEMLSVAVVLDMN